MNLPEILLQNGIEIEQWSHQYGTKELQDLEAEIQAGETSLEIINNQLTRVVKLVKIEIKVMLGDRRFILVEDKQIFYTGAIRKRNVKSISEKIKGGETPEAAALRALKEEIGFLGDKALSFVEENTEEKISPSYPGLNCLYKTFKYQLTLKTEDLADFQFSEVQPDKISLFTLEPEDES